MKLADSLCSASTYPIAAALLLAFTVTQAVRAETVVPMPIHLESLEQVESKGLCFISQCEEYGANARLQPAELAQLNSWRTSDRPWARALSWVCDANGSCVNSTANNRLPLTKLSAALNDPAAQVRALALTRLDTKRRGIICADATALGKSRSAQCRFCPVSC
jgi:hypothetical protein